MKMEMMIDIDIYGDEITISEANSTGVVYSIKGKTWPAVINDICDCLHVYMENLPHESHSPFSEEDIENLSLNEARKLIYGK